MLTSIKIKEYNIYQDTELQSVTLDSILISDFVKINRRSKNILDIGTGNAIIPILISKRTSANITGVEILEKSYNIALKNVEENNISINLVNMDVLEYAKNKHQEYDIIISNPPYFDDEENVLQMKQNSYKQIARNFKKLNFENLIRVSSYMLKNNGHFYVVIRTKSLNNFIILLEKYNLSAKVLKFVYTKNNTNAKLVLIDCIKNSSKDLIVENPIYVYDENGNKSEYINSLYSTNNWNAKLIYGKII